MLLPNNCLHDNTGVTPSVIPDYWNEHWKAEHAKTGSADFSSGKQSPDGSRVLNVYLLIICSWLTLFILDSVHKAAVESLLYNLHVTRPGVSTPALHFQLDTCCTYCS